MGSSVLGEELSSGGVPTELHASELKDGPGVEVGRPAWEGRESETRRAKGEGGGGRGGEGGRDEEIERSQREVQRW